MPNEFKVKNGLIVDQGGAFITGSSSISGSLSVTGSFTASLQSGYVWVGDGSGISRAVATSSFITIIPSGSISGSSQIIGILSSLNSYTASNDTTNTTQNARLTALENATGSLSQSISFINNLTASFSASSSADAARLTALELASASLQFFTSSQNTKNSTLATYTGSVDTKFTAVGASTSSLNAFTASILTALTASGVNLTANGNLTVQGNFTVAGTQTIVNSTTIQLGDNIIELNGTGVANGGIYVKDPTAPTTGTGSFLWNSTGDFWIAGLSGSEQRILVVGSMGVVSGSSQISLAGTSDYSGLFGGIGASTSSLNLFTASAAIRLTNLETTSASVNISISNINAFTASQITKDATLATYTGSIDTKFTAVAASTASLNTFTASLSTTSNVVFNTVSASAITSSFNIPATAVSGSTTSKRMVFRDTTGKLELVATASIAGDFVQWDGGSFVMSNVIDGGSF